MKISKLKLYNKDGSVRWNVEFHETKHGFEVRDTAEYSLFSHKYGKKSLIVPRGSFELAMATFLRKEDKLIKSL